MLIGKSLAHSEDELKEHGSEEYSHIDNDQSGDRIACLELVPDIVCYGFNHFLKCRSIHR
jgi:hypothetical protein